MRTKKPKKITLTDLADDLMFETYKLMMFRDKLPEEGNMKKIFRKYLRKAMQLATNTLTENGSDTTD